MIEGKDKIGFAENMLNILIVEDEEYNFMYLVEALSHYQVSILRAYHGKMAVDICSRNPDIHLVLMDLRMPVMDGFQATRLIKQIHPDLPVIVQTAYMAESFRDQSMMADFDDYLCKPISKANLLNVVAKYAPHNFPLLKRQSKSEIIE